MSTDVSVYDEDSFHRAMADVRSDQTETNWALFGHHDNNPNVLYVVGSGSQGVEEAASYLDDSQYMYGLVRLEETIDMSQTVKFVFVKHSGKDVPFAKKGKYGVVQGAIDALFTPYHIMVETDSAEELTSDLIHTRLQETSGTKSKVLEAAEAKVRPERGFTSGTTTKTDPTGSTPTKSAHLIGIGKGGSSFSGFSGKAKGSSGVEVTQEVRDAVLDVKSDGTETNWCAAAYEDNNVKKPISLLGSGSGSLEDIKGFCGDDNIVFGYIRLTDVVDDIPTVKFVYIQWVGESTKTMSKAKVSTHKGTLEEVFKPAHVTIYANAPTELNQRLLMDKVSSASGSKKSHVK